MRLEQFTSYFCIWSFCMPYISYSWGRSHAWRNLKLIRFCYLKRKPSWIGGQQWDFPVKSLIKQASVTCEFFLRKKILAYVKHFCIIKGTLMHISEYVNTFVFIWKYYVEDFSLKHLLLFEICTRTIGGKFAYEHSETIEYVKN